MPTHHESVIQASQSMQAEMGVLKANLLNQVAQLIDNSTTQSVAKINVELVNLTEAVSQPDSAPPTDSLPSARLSKHLAPKLAQQMQNNCPHQSPNYTNAWSDVGLYDLIVADAETVANAPDMLGPTGSIRTTNPNAVILHYFSGGDIPNLLPDDLWDITHAVKAGMTESMYAHSAAGNRLAWYNFGDGNHTWLVNHFIDPFIISSEQLGSSYPFYLANKMVELVLDTGLSDGIFYDWMSSGVNWKYPGQIDVDENSVGDSAAMVDGLYRKGFLSLLFMTRLINQGNGNPEKIIAGNAGWVGDNSYASVVNGSMFEQFLMSDNTIAYSWANIMKSYAMYNANCQTPKVNFISYAGEDANIARFSLCSSLMFDGYFHWTNIGAYTTAKWLDEYSVNPDGIATPKNPDNKGYLGLPIDIARSITTPTNTLQDMLSVNINTAGATVWYRDYSGGRVLINPHKTNTFNVNLGRTFRRITGTTAYNPGGTVTSVTMGPRSGLILVNMPVQ